jgi:putative ABC transport system permease protein
MTALNRKLIRDIVALRGPLLSIALVVAAGVMSAITMQSTYRSLEAARTRYFREHRFADLFANLERAPEAAAHRLAAIPGVSAVQTRVVMDVLLTIPGLPRAATGHIVSVPEPRSPMLNDLHVRAGRWVGPGSDDEVMVSERFAEANGLIVGDTVSAILNGRRRTLDIVGIALSPEFIYEVSPASGFFTDERLFGVLWMRREALAAANNMEGAFNEIALRLAPGASERAVIEGIDDLLERYGGRGAYGRRDQISNRILSDEIAQNRTTATVVPIVFLGVAAFLLHIVLMRLIATQREQIGLLKAFGYRDAEVATHYVLLAATAVGVGAVIGLLGGFWLGSGYTDLYGDYFKFPALEFRMDPEIAAGAIAISAIAAIAGALTAVRSVLGLQPAVGMRAEAPAVFRPLILERWGLHRWLTAGQRMVLRNVERRPGRAVLSATAVGFALAVFMTGLVLLDSITMMVDRQFNEVQREDVTIAFSNARDASSVNDIVRIPGVTLAEPYRAVPIEIRRGHITRRLAITGLSPSGRLRRMIDSDGNPYQLPEGGVVLTAKLADVMGVAVGDTVHIDLLDRRWDERSLVVAAVMDEYVGINAWMALPALNRLLREGPRVSGVNIAIGRGEENGVYDRLRELPAVASTVSRKAMIESFEDQMAEGMVITLGVMLVLASVLGVGVIYNGARIALSERGRELASLRVLGFSRAEVARLLLGEQAIITFAGIPFGVLVGYGIAVLISRAYDTELYRMPLVFEWSTAINSALVIVAVATVAALLVRRKLDRADLISVLKSRE